jgi:uncharacterized protein YbjT (DUF2867 family)
VRILVAGGSGVLGSHVVERMRANGHQAIVMSRRAGAGPNWRQADIASGEGLKAALDGAEVVLHAASAAAEFTKIKRTDVEGTEHLVREAEKAGVKHFVFISIVGVDRIDYGYYRAKLAAEDTIRAGSVPWSILRATQFHEFIDRILRAAAKGPFLFVPKGVSDQPVAGSEVADRLVEMAASAPTRAIENMGGPEVLTVDELAHPWLLRRGDHRRLVRIPVPGKPGPGFRAGYHLSPEGGRGRQTWQEWLDQAYAGGRVPTAYSKRARTDS